MESQEDMEDTPVMAKFLQAVASTVILLMVGEEEDHSITSTLDPLSQRMVCYFGSVKL